MAQHKNLWAKKCQPNQYHQLPCQQVAVGHCVRGLGYRGGQLVNKAAWLACSNGAMVPYCSQKGAALLSIPRDPLLPSGPLSSLGCKANWPG